MTAPNGAIPEGLKRLMTAANGAVLDARPLDADECDVLIDRFGERIRWLHAESTAMLAEFDELQRRYLRHIERRE